jgi:hypothetical protein
MEGPVNDARAGRAAMTKAGFIPSQTKEAWTCRSQRPRSITGWEASIR